MGDEGYRLSVDAEPTSSFEQRNESKVQEAFANFLSLCLIDIALQANRAESLPFLSIRVASLL